MRVRDAVLHRDGGRVDRVRLRYHSRPLALPGSSGAAAAGRPRRELDARLDEPASGVAPGQTAALMDGELIVGHATIA